MTTFPELREAQRQVSEFKGDLDSDEFKSRIEVLRFRAALSADAVLAHIDAQAAEIERLRELMRAVLDTRDAEAKAQRAFQNALDNYSGEHRSYGIAHTKAMCAASDAEKAARAALEQTK